MSDDFRMQVYNTLRWKRTDELIKIWKRNDHRERSELAFEVIREILQERLGEIPPQDKPVYGHVEQDADKMLKRKYRKYILLAISIVLIILGLRYVIFLNARHHLLCEELKFGMSVDDALGVLRQNGEFMVNKGEWGGGLIELDIKFTDLRGDALYGGFILGFSRYQYDLATTYGNLDFGPRRRTICSLGQVTPSVTETPKP